MLYLNCALCQKFLSSSPGLPRAHPESYHSYMWNNFFKHIDIEPVNAHILDGNAEDLEAECQAYEQKIAEAGGIELFVGGQTHNVQCRISQTAWWKFHMDLLIFWVI